MAGSYNTVINLYIGENQFVNCTENMVSIDNNRIASNVSASTVIELYDDTALVIDSILASSSDREIEFEYGYVNGAMSDRYSGTITKYQTQFVGHSALCTIECVSTGVATQELGDNSNKSKSYSGTISDIVYQVASEESWEVGKIEATEYKVFTVTRADESALKFVEGLRSKAISAETGKGDFKVRLEDKDSKSIIYFATEITVEETEEDTGDFNVYDYQYVLGMPNENIISFKPQYEQVLSSLVGATALVTSSMDPETNEITEIQVAGERTKEERDKNIEIEPEEDEAIKIVKRYVGGNSHSAEDLTTMAKNLYDIASSLSYKATLVLKGKPRITPNTKISILVLTREGQRHHSSGTYCIASVDDLVENGTFTTTLEMMKNVDSVTVTVNQSPESSAVWGGTGYRGYGNSVNSQNLIWVGDSRGVGMQSSVTSNSRDTFIVRGAMSYTWFRDTAIPQIKSKLGSNPNQSVIIMMGVNDCANACVGGGFHAEEYSSRVNELISNYPNSSFYFMSVNPVDGNYSSSYSPTGYIAKDTLNSKIRDFNSIIKSKCKAIYLDCYSYLISNGFKTSDGIHYNSDTYKKIYNFVISKLPVSTGVTDSDFSAKVAKYLGTPYVWGGDSWEEGGFDCSGFAWHFLKYECGSTTIGGRDTAANLSNRGVSVPYDSSYSQMKPGDLCFKGNPASHVVVYMGGGRVVHSPQTGDVIKWADLWFTPSKVKRYL